MAPQAEQKAVTRNLKDEERRERGWDLPLEKQDIERLMADKSDTEMQEALARSSHVEYDSQSQRLSDSSYDFYVFNPVLCEKAMNFMRNLHLGTGRDIEPREALVLVAQAEEDDILALHRYLLANPAFFSTPGYNISGLRAPPMWSNRFDDAGSIFPQPFERWRWPPAKDLETVGGPGKEHGKKRRKLFKFFCSGTKGQEESAGPFAKLNRSGFR